jgi:muramoyltetrapeptide carboxypeptidase
MGLKLFSTRLTLQPGDVVDVVAPGFRCSEENLQAGATFLKGLGLTPRLPEDLFGDDLLCANSDDYRYAHLKKALFARDSRAVWCVRAGYGAIRFIERLRHLQPPRRRKLFIGYSDATTIHYLLNQHWKWPSLHGPLLDRLGTATVRAEELDELRAVLFGTCREVSFGKLIPLNKAAARQQVIRSRVFGGNLTVLQTVLGTRLQRDHTGILFLEDIGERGYRVDRMLQHFEQAGALRKLKAIVFGAFVGGQELDGGYLAPAVLERFAQEQKVPVLLGMEAGHGEYQRPVCFNTPAELRCGAQPRLQIGSV